jgi:hypothetical protein
MRPTIWSLGYRRGGVEDPILQTPRRLGWIGMLLPPALPQLEQSAQDWQEGKITTSAYGVTRQTPLS